MIYTIDDIFALPEGERAELIDGNIYLMSPPSPRYKNMLVQSIERLLTLLM